MYGSLKRKTFGLLSFQNMKGLKGVIFTNIYFTQLLLSRKNLLWVIIILEVW